MFYPELKGRPLQAYRNLVNKLKAIARTEAVTDIVTRPLRPEDVGMPNPEWRWTATAAAGWATLIDAQEIADKRFVGIYGVRNAEAAGTITELRIKAQGEIVKYWPIQEITYFENQTGFADDPVIIKQNTSITLESWQRTSSTLTAFELVGVVVEKRGLLINP